MTLPADPWLGMNLTKQWTGIFESLWQSFPWEHPIVLAHYPRPEENTFRKMLLDSKLFQEKLDLLPRTICHGDTYPTNFMSRPGIDSQQHTVALDWALMGIGPVGDDLGQLAFGANMNLKETNRADIIHTLFDSYLDGLNDSGYRSDPKSVRFGFTASAALRVGLFQLFLLEEDLEQSQNAAKENDKISVVPECFEVAMAKEAYELLESKTRGRLAILSSHPR